MLKSQIFDITYLQKNYYTIITIYFVAVFLFFIFFYFTVTQNWLKTLQKNFKTKFTIYNYKCNTCLKISALTLNKYFIAVFKMKTHGTTL